jgi:hypothetical protein
VREVGLQAVDGAVRTVVVDHEDLASQALQRTLDGSETLPEVVFDVVADDNDGHTFSVRLSPLRQDAFSSGSLHQATSFFEFSR